MEHTKGPWRIGDMSTTIFGPPNGSPSPEVIAHLAGHGKPFPTDKTRANGRLIAAAPVMLEALEALTEAIDLSKSKVKRDFHLLNVHACATKIIYLAKGDK